MATVTFLRRHDHDGWAVLVDGAQVGTVLSHRTTSSWKPRPYTVWTFPGDPCSDNYRTRSEAVQALLDTL